MKWMDDDEEGGREEKEWMRTRTSERWINFVEPNLSWFMFNVQIKMWLCVCNWMWKWGWNRLSKSNNQFFISFSSLHHTLLFNHFTLIWWLWFSINVNEWWYWKQIERVIIITKYINQLSSSSHCIEFSSANRYLERSDAISDDGAFKPQLIGSIPSISLSDGLLESWLIDEKWNDKMNVEQKVIEVSSIDQSIVVMK